MRNMKRILSFLLATGFLFFTSGVAIGAIWYVDGQAEPDPTDCNGGNTWDTAFMSAYKAHECASAGDEIWVKEGVYNSYNYQLYIGWKEVSVTKEVSFYGSFAGDETNKDDRDLRTHRTIIVGVYAPFQIRADTTIDGFEFKGSSSPFFIGSPDGAYAPSVVISNIIAYLGTQGAEIYAGSITFTNYTILDMYDSVFSISNSSVAFTNCTLWNNGDYPRERISADSFATFTNCIYWGNSTAFGDLHADSSKLTATYSNIEGGYPGKKNIDADPLFVSSSDLHLSELSPCIDSGTSVGAPSTDFEGTPRPQGKGYDMGAYEYVSTDTDPMLDVTYPEEGDLLWKGNDYRIKWSWSNLSEDRLIRIHVFKEKKFHETIAASVKVGEGITGVVFNPPVDPLPPKDWPISDKYMIKISTLDDEVFAESGYFTIMDFNEVLTDQKVPKNRIKEYPINLSSSANIAILSSGPLDLKGELKYKGGGRIDFNNGYTDIGDCTCLDGGADQIENGNDQDNFMIRAELTPGEYTLEVTPENVNTAIKKSFSLIFLKRPTDADEFFAGLDALLNDGHTENDYFDIYVKALYDYYDTVDDIIASANYGSTLCDLGVCKERQCKALTNFYLSQILGIGIMRLDSIIADQWNTFTDIDTNCIADENYILSAGDGDLIYHSSDVFGPVLCGEGPYCFDPETNETVRGRDCDLDDYREKGDIFVDAINLQQDYTHKGIIYDGDFVIDANYGCPGCLQRANRRTRQWKVARPW